MWRQTLSILVLFCATHVAVGQAKPLKVFISADMEGIDGVVDGDQVKAQGSEYGRARKLMIEEVNSAIDGAVAAGAAEILVNDSHSTHRSLFIEDLRSPARLASNYIKPDGMMEGLDSTFAAVILIGYHARAGSPVGVLAHTGSGEVADLVINGNRVGESGMNTLYAASFGVPVVMLTGDNIAIQQARELTPDIEAVQVKEAIGTRGVVYRPLDRVRAEIRATAERAVRNAGTHKTARVASPSTFELTFYSPTLADLAEAIPTVKRTGPATITYAASDYRAGYRLLRLLYRFMGNMVEIGYPPKP